MPEVMDPTPNETDQLISLIEKVVPVKCRECYWAMTCLHYPSARRACQDWGSGKVPVIPRCSTCHDNDCKSIGAVRPAPGDGSCYKADRGQ